MHDEPDLLAPLPEISVVIPVHNEEGSIEKLYERLCAVLEAHYPSFEIIFVDDASQDRTYQLLTAIAANDARVTIIRLKRNFGQTPALAAGFDYARGDIIVSMDGDLQHDPSDLPALVEPIYAGYDLASGWRHKRVDNLVLRRIPSRIANWLMAKLSGVELHDFGTTFKAYRRDTIKRIRLYGELPGLFRLLQAGMVRASLKSPSKMSTAKKGNRTTVSHGHFGCCLIWSPYVFCSSTSPVLFTSSVCPACLAFLSA
jgi:glycosyltransferase involved in cell wall biosynthesis